ncbi:MAG: rubredoxin [Desulfobacterales bacterium]|nr:MAG: rubredoxin [Desulfobacterales bacterium]
MKKWICTICAYLHKGGEPPEKCAVCGADRSLFEAAADRMAEKDGAAPDAASDAAPDIKWKCTVCAYRHTGPEPPEKCRVCGADASLFLILAEDEAPAAEMPEPEPAATVSTKSPPPEIPPGGGIFRWFIGQMVRHHLHPVSAQAPGGVLPAAVLFIMGAVFLQFGELAVAIFYNLAVTTLVMPVVIFSGVIEWKQGYGGRLTSMFIIKMCAAATVFIFVLCLTVWMATDPDVLESPRRWIFFAASLVMLGAVAIAGLLGGKLVYKD